MTDKKDEIKPHIITKIVIPGKIAPDKITEKGTRDIVRDDIDRGKIPIIPPIVIKKDDGDKKP